MAQNILVVDDEELVRKTLVRLLEREGFSVSATGSGKEALQMVSRGPFDVFFLDLKMPEMDGISLCREIKKIHPKSVAFALTAFVSEYDIGRCREAGFDDYFMKPFKIDNLVKAATEAFERIARWDATTQSGSQPPTA
jgi:CheY-like chemotaxis protein